MTISTKAELRTALGGIDGLLHRAHSNAKLDEFILMGESRLNRKLRILDMVTTQTATLSTAAATLALPTRYADKIQFRINDPEYELVWVEPAKIKEFQAALTTTGQPRRYTVTDTFEFDCVPDSAYSYTLKYFKGYQLAADADTNYVLANYPQAYLYAAAIDGATYSRQWELADRLEGRLRLEIAEIKRAEARRKGTDDARLSTDFNQRRSRFSIEQG